MPIHEIQHEFALWAYFDFNIFNGFDSVVFLNLSRLSRVFLKASSVCFFRAPFPAQDPSQDS
jgi:hypothetical protein